MLVSGRLAITMTTVCFLKLTMARHRDISKRARELWCESRHISYGCISEKRRREVGVDHPGVLVKVDRVACPWLIKNFVDKDAEFLFVPADKVMERKPTIGCNSCTTLRTSNSVITARNALRSHFEKTWPYE